MSFNDFLPNHIAVPPKSRRHRERCRLCSAKGGARPRSGPYATETGPLFVSEQLIDGALDFYRVPVPTRHVRITHGRLDLAVAEQLLDVAKFRSRLEDVGAKECRSVREVRVLLIPAREVSTDRMLLDSLMSATVGSCTRSATRPDAPTAPFPGIPTCGSQSILSGDAQHKRETVGSTFPRSPGLNT